MENTLTTEETMQQPVSMETSGERAEEITAAAGEDMTDETAGEREENEQTDMEHDGDEPDITDETEDEEMTDEDTNA